MLHANFSVALLAYLVTLWQKLKSSRRYAIANSDKGQEVYYVYVHVLTDEVETLYLPVYTIT